MFLTPGGREKISNPALSSVPFFSEHLKNMRKIFMHGRERKLFLFLDEVQKGPTGRSSWRRFTSFNKLVAGFLNCLLIR
jgi:hypothetical protein